MAAEICKWGTTETHDVRDRKRRIVAIISVLDGKLDAVMFAENCNTPANRELVLLAIEKLGIVCP